MAHHNLRHTHDNLRITLALGVTDQICDIGRFATPECHSQAADSHGRALEREQGRRDLGQRLRVHPQRCVLLSDVEGLAKDAFGGTAVAFQSVRFGQVAEHPGGVERALEAARASMRRAVRGNL